MRGLTLVLVGLMFGPMGCSSTTSQAATGSASEEATLVSATSVVQATVDGTRIFGPQLELSRNQETLRGRGPIGVVDLRKANNSLRGVVGGGPTELYVERDGNDGFSLRGLYSGGLGELEVRADRIQGQLGHCQYNLRRYGVDEGVSYNGRRVCGRTWSESATFTLSPGIAALEPLDRAALIALLLGR